MPSTRSAHSSFVVSWSNDKQRVVPCLLGFPEVREYLCGILWGRRFDFDSESVVNVGVARPRVRFLAAILCEDRDREAACSELLFDLEECFVVGTPPAACTPPVSGTAISSPASVSLMRSSSASISTVVSRYRDRFRISASASYDGGSASTSSKSRLSSSSTASTATQPFSLTASFSKLETPDHLRNRTVQVIARNIEDVVSVGRWSRC